MGKKRERILRTHIDFRGRTVAILASCWNNHVLRNHPDMALRIDDVAATLAGPDLVLENDVKDFKNWLYYKDFGSQPGNVHLKVCVRWDPQFGTE